MITSAGSKAPRRRYSSTTSQAVNPRCERRAEEEFVDDAFSCDANRTLLFPCGMGRYHHAAREAIGADWHVWTIVEAADDLAFRALLDLIIRRCRRACTCG